MYFAKTKKIFCLMISLSSTQLSAAGSEPKIDRINYASDGSVELHGSHFGTQCAKCEVVVKYSRSLIYSVPVIRWTKSKIEIELPDLNQNEESIQIQAKRPDVMSNSKLFRLKPRYRVISREHRSHVLSVGEKGEDKFKVKNAPLVCGKNTFVFDHVEMEFKKQRFSDAKIVKMPRKGCNNCKPIVVRWYNEPTGLLSYELKIVGRIVQGVCETRRQRSQ